MFIFRWLGQGFSFLWKALDFLRRAIANLIFIALLIAVVVWGLGFSNVPNVGPNTVLVLDLTGNVVEQKPQTSLLGSSILDQKESDTALHELLQTLKKAEKDRAVRAILLRLDDLQQVGLANIREIGAALDRFKRSGKPVWAWGTNFTQSQYAIAAHANEIFLHPMGEIHIKGLGSNRLYYGELLEKLGVNVHVFKAGDYKSFPESFVLSAPSKAALEAEKVWLFNAWKTFSTDMERSRGLMPNVINGYIDELPQRVRMAKGDMALVASNAGLIDGIKTFDEVKDYIEMRLTKGKKINANFLSYVDYDNQLNTTSSPGSVAIIVAEGEIQTGLSDIGIIGSKTVAQQLRQADEDPNIKAVVLRVNSPGGSAVASELIRRAIELTKNNGKPVIVSMGDTAASGGYWISMGATRIVADPTTITGSIGVFGLAPTFEKSLELAKIGQGGVGTTWLANAEKSTRPLDPRLAEILTLNVERTYNNFLAVVSKARQLHMQQVHEVAQGRIWTGEQAAERRLVDQVGGLQDAISLARQLAKLPQSAPLTYIDGSAISFSSMVRNSLKQWKNPLSWVELPQGAASELKKAHAFWQSRLAQPREVLAHSLCHIDQ